MPRGKKKQPDVSIAEKIEAIKKEIDKLGEELKEKKAALKKLEKEAAEEKKAQLLKAVEESGKSIDDVLDFLKK